MSVILTLLVRNEIDIIKTHLDYHLSLGIDHIIITDNLSDDGTEEILQEYSKLDNITVLKEEEDNYAQSKWVTKMAHYAQEKLNAEWIIHSDCDEFFIPYQWSQIHEILGQFSKRIDFVNIERYDFVPLLVLDGNPIKNMVHKKMVSTNILGHRLPPKVIHRNIPKLVVDAGNHSISYPTNLISLDCQEVEIFHYPVRSLSQFESKIGLGANACALNTELDPNICGHWRHLHEIQRNVGLKEEYNEMIYDEIKLREEIDQGVLVRDTSLADRINEI